MNNAITKYFKNEIGSCNGDQRKLFSIVNNVLARKNSMLPMSESDEKMANDFIEFFKNKIERICKKLPAVDMLAINDDAIRNVTFAFFK